MIGARGQSMILLKGAAVTEHSSFFRPIPGSPDALDDDEPLLRLSPVWSGPPWHGQPVPAALAVELGRSDTTLVLIEGARAYREGVVLRLVVRVRETAREARRRLFAQLEFTSGREVLNMGLVPGGLRWGFEFADGQRGDQPGRRTLGVIAAGHRSDGPPP
jgi:hypothetical protein